MVYPYIIKSFPFPLWFHIGYFVSFVCFHLHLIQQHVDIQPNIQIQCWNCWPNALCNLTTCHMKMDNCPVCDKKILQHARKIICCICNKIFHMKCLTLCDKDLYSLECARHEWFCELCLSYSLPFNHIDDNADFYAAIRGLSESTADSLRYLSEKVFQPFESDINSYD